MEFEKLLGKHISVFEKVIGNDFENKLHGKYLYYIPNKDIKKYFLEVSYYAISIVVDKSDVLESISLRFYKIIDKQFYSSLVDKYRAPNSILVPSGSYTITSESIIKDDSDSIVASTRKREVDLREGTFNEKPFVMIWKKENFYIQAFLRYEQNISEITFSIDGSPFIIKPK